MHFSPLPLAPPQPQPQPPRSGAAPAAWRALSKAERETLVRSYVTMRAADAHGVPHALADFLAGALGDKFETLDALVEVRRALRRRDFVAARRAFGQLRLTDPAAVAEAARLSCSLADLAAANSFRNRRVK